MSKIGKNAFRKSIEKKKAKKEAKEEATAPVRGEGSKNARFLLRKVFALIFDRGSTHATTPGGVRRILFAHAIPADP